MFTKLFQILAAALIAAAVLLFTFYPPPPGWKPGMTGSEARANHAAAQRASLQEPPSPAPVPESPPETLPEPPAPLLLPEGQYVTLRRVTEMTPSGVLSIPAGRQVTLLRLYNGLARITDGRVEMSAVPAHYLTNDQERALTVLEANAAAQAKEREEANGLQASLDQIAEQERLQAQAQLPAPVVAPPPQPDPRVVAVLASLDQRIAFLQSEMERLENKRKDSPSHISAVGPVVTRLRLEQEKLRGQRAALTR